MFVSKMLERKNRNWGGIHSQVRRDMESRGDKLSDYSGEELLTYLCGDCNNCRSTKLDVYILKPQKEKWYHRMNMMWAFPLTLICSPYQYIKNGGVGWDNKSIIGRFILKAVGADSD